LLAFSHELRMTGGEFNVESSLTIRKLSATLSYCVYFDNLKQTFRSFSRRGLCFAYLRRWDLICLAACDTKAILKKGKIPLLRSLLSLKALFAKSETMYLLNRLFIDDILIWIQSLNEQRFSEFVNKTVDELSEIFVVGCRLPSSSFIGWKLLGVVGSNNNVVVAVDDVFEGVE
jgi:hypothetical protein